MEHQTSQNDLLLARIKEIGQATFFCYNESSQKLPVAILRNLEFENDNTLSFPCNYFPITEQRWDVFAGELRCTKKGLPFSFVLHGIAAVNDISAGKVRFTIQYIESFGLENVEENNQSVLALITKPYRYISQMSTSLFNSFRKKETISPLNNAAA